MRQRWKESKMQKIVCESQNNKCGNLKCTKQMLSGSWKAGKEMIGLMISVLSLTLEKNWK